MSIHLFKDRIRRGLELTEQEALAALQRLQLVVSVGDLVAPDPAEEVRPFFGGIDSPGVAAEYTMHQLWNPAGSGRLLRVALILISTPNSRTYRFGWNTVENVMTGAAHTCAPGDTRYPYRGPAAILYHGSAGALVGGAADVLDLKSDPNGVRVYHPPNFFVVAPSYSLLVQNTTVNEASNVGFYWTEEKYSAGP